MDNEYISEMFEARSTFLINKTKLKISKVRYHSLPKLNDRVNSVFGTNEEKDQRIYERSEKDKHFQRKKEYFVVKAQPAQQGANCAS